ncbi:MAG: zinc ribbon domain-containing protein [Candidatus Heimdallarchaeaceae archaeon]
MAYEYSKDKLTTLFKVSAGIFALSATLDLITEFVRIIALVWIWIVIYFLSFIFFAYVLFKLSKSFTVIGDNIKRAANFIIVLVVIDVLKFLDAFFDFLGIVLFFLVFFGYSILRGVAFTLLNSTLKKFDPKISNPIFPIYGWMDLVSIILFLALPAGIDDIELLISFYLEIALIFAISIVLWTISRKLLTIKVTPTTVAQPYVPQTLYQPAYQTSYAQPAQIQQEENIEIVTKTKAQQFCKNCGVAIEEGAKFCTNCGSKI